MIVRCLRIAVVLSALVLLLPAPVSADLGGFVIKDFHTELTVEPNADLLVAERLEVEFLEPRHGIYRTVPVRYTDPRGFMYSLGFRLLDVTNDAGQAYGTKVSNEGQYVKVRIGDPDREVEGRQVYVIRYRVSEAVRHLSEHDELYWNAVGDEWQTDIEAASASVYLPAPLEADSLEFAGYTGSFGSQEQDVAIGLEGPGVLSFVSNRLLEPREGMTVVVAWPHGYVEFPSAADRLLRFLIDNLILAIPFINLAVLYRKYRQSGRDPEGPAAVTVRYEPPEGVGPAEIGTILDEEVDLRDITAVVVNLAVRGFLKIGTEERAVLFWKSETTVFERNVERDTSDLLPHERQILDGLFEGGDRVTSEDLRSEFYTHLPGIRDALYERLVERGFFTADPSSVRTKWMLLGIGAGILTFAAGAVWAVFRGAIMPFGLVTSVLAAAVTAVLFWVFAPAMPRRTNAGVRLRSWALGFEEFVGRVESDRLERDEARDIFEALLPYAMALGVAASWARKFEGIYEQAGPTWYMGPYVPGAFSTGGFEHSLSSAMADTAKGMAETPRSSGSSGIGGGGFSGGGVGGGGGGSW